MDFSRESDRVPAKVRAKTFILLAFMIVIGPLGNVFLRVGMRDLGPLHWTSTSVVATAAGALGSWAVWAGILSRILFLVAYMLVLSWADYSFVTPVSSVSYAVVVLMGALMLGEVVPLQRWAGVGLICLGVALVGSTSPSTSERPSVSRPAPLPTQELPKAFRDGVQPR